jgi:hypothetical protein
VSSSTRQQTHPPASESVAADPASLLPGRGGQMVGALDVAEVAVLQDRLGPALDVVEHLEDQSAVTEPAAGSDGGA